VTERSGVKNTKMSHSNDDNDAFFCEVGYVSDPKRQIAAIFYRKVVKGKPNE